MSVSASAMQESCGGDCSVSVLLHPKNMAVVSIFVSTWSLLVSTNYLTIEACLHAHIKYNEAQ